MISGSSSSKLAFIDPFARQAASYALHRPLYPPALVAHVLAAVVPPSSTRPQRSMVDIGTGSGQFLQDVAPHFDRVLATDRSREQLARAPAFPNVRYVHAEDSTIALDALPPADTDLVSAAQMIHWTTDPRDLHTLMSSIARVLRPTTGIAAFAGYAVCRPRHPRVAAAFKSFYASTAHLWDPRCDRNLLDRGLTDLNLSSSPRLRRRSHEWFIHARTLTVDAFLKYLGTWSAVAPDPSVLDPFAEDLRRIVADDDGLETDAEGAGLLDVDFPFFCLLAERSSTDQESF